MGGRFSKKGRLSPRAGNEGFYRLVVEQVPDFIVVVDKALRIQYINHLAPGYSLASVVGKSVANFIGPGEREKAREAIEAAFASGAPQEYEVLADDGAHYYTRTLPVREGGRCDQVILVATDVTKGREAEKKLVQSEMRNRELDAERQVTENRWRALVHDAPDIIAIISADGTLRFINRLNETGRSEEVIGSDVYSWIPRALHRSFRERVGRVLQTGQAESYRMTMDRPKGERVHYQSRIGLLSRPGNEPELMIISRDVTTETELEQRLRLSDRLFTMGTLVAGLAHELNNPLTYVISNLGFTLEKLKKNSGVPLNKQTVQGLEDAYEGAQRAAQVVRDLRSMAVGADGEDSEVVDDLRAVIETSARMASNEIRHLAEVRLELDELPPVKGNSSRLGQVFLNLLMNAAQAVEEGGDKEQSIVIHGASAKGFVVVSVKDTGCGIRSEIQERIFDPFYTTKHQIGGSGLGLAICQRIVTDVGGDIRVHSEVGNGTSVEVWLPILDRHEPSGFSAITSALEPGYRILIVDDQPAVLRALQVQLQDQRVVSAGNGHVALKLLSQEQSYDLMICDLMMPEMSGVELFERLCEARHPIIERTIFITGGAFSEKSRRFLQETKRPCIHKPFTRDELRMRLAQVLAESPLAMKRGNTGATQG